MLCFQCHKAISSKAIRLVVLTPHSVRGDLRCCSHECKETLRKRLLENGWKVQAEQYIRLIGRPAATINGG